MLASCLAVRLLVKERERERDGGEGAGAGHSSHILPCVW